MYWHHLYPGKGYLTSIMALYSRKIIGWKLTDSLEVANVIPLIERTKQQRNIKQSLIMHSDRGRQFTSEVYNQVPAWMTLSYSKKAYPFIIPSEFTVIVILCHLKILKPNTILSRQI